jgi:TonB family protein
MKATFVLIVVLLLTLPVLGADPEPYLKSAPMPFYPPLALQARIEGKVSLHFAIDEQGQTAEVEAITGNKMLQDAAIDNIRDWKFWPPRCACRVRREAVFVYRLSADAQSEATVVVKWFGKAGQIRVEIEGEPAQIQWQP